MVSYSSRIEGVKKRAQAPPQKRDLEEGGFVHEACYHRDRWQAVSRCRR